VKHRHPVLIGVYLSALWAVGCTSPTSPSSSSPSSSSLPVSQSAIENAVLNFSRGATTAANSSNLGTTNGFRSLDQVLQRLTVLVNESFFSRTVCAVGGHHETSGRISGSIETEGGGTARLQLNATTTIFDYACMANGWLVNGDPYISHAGEVRVTGATAALDFRSTLGWLANNPTTGGSFSCQHNVLVTYASSTGGRIQGSVICTPPRTTISINLTF